MKIKTLLIAGTRPNFIKLAPLYHTMKNDTSFEVSICHTGQHFDANMSDVFWDSLQIPSPTFSLNVRGTNVPDTIGKTIIAINEVVVNNSFDLIVVFGDVNATVAGAITASQNGVKVAHIEAGLRSFDRRMPEEINRMITDKISDYLFVSEQSGMDNLKTEGEQEDKYFLVGNIMIDCLVQTRQYWEAVKLSEIEKEFVAAKPTIATFHRPENVDSANTLEQVINIISTVAQKNKIIFPLHPRTKNNLEKFNLLQQITSNKNILITEPKGYFEFLYLVKNASLVITDSGGIQEESSFLNIPCVTFRNNTERPITIDKGTNILLNINDNDFEQKIEEHIAHRATIATIDIPFWDGKVSERIVHILKEKLS